MRTNSRTAYRFGLVSNQESAVAEETPKRKLPENAEVIQGTFKINVKDDNDAILYTNDAEPYEYVKVPSLETALEYYGAELSADQKQFLTEALAGSDKTGEAVKTLIEIINADLKTSAKNNAYQSVFNKKKPLTEENIDNATASIVRNFLKLNQGVSDETAITTLQGYGVIPKEFTVAEYRGNKGKR